ncbi:DNA polymerase III subunit epsilon [Tengunoibacter tsumagoiensis]|uniref:DNA polymerase III subunit epsilon n=1 Tax=Tengunoibacter tsumagoiensis TaxID=2014871 RepID=A0A402A7P3_9CHLR|nr:DNA polymerase III subunit epsilon [Tengunoibacter tsumagoiensis]
MESFDFSNSLRPVFLDTETTGTQIYSEVIEIAIVDEHGYTLFHTLIKPIGSFDPRAIRVHGITSKDVKNAPYFEDVYSTIFSYLNNVIVIAYNVSFDIRLLKQTSEIHNLTLPRLHIACLMHAYLKFKGVEYNHSKPYKLEDALTNEQIPFPPLHRAERDAQCVYRLFHFMREKTD